MLINCQELIEWSGYSRPADVIKWLNHNGIKWWPAKEGLPCTTLRAIEDQLCGTDKQAKEVKF